MSTVTTAPMTLANPPRNRFRWLKRIVFGPPRAPRWSRLVLLAILALATVLYTWGLSQNGTGNSYYAAAVLSGTKSWKAAFFGAFDSAGFITVDKPPLSLWPQVVSARVFGFSSWSVLLPQAVAGVLTVGVLHAAVRRSLGYTAAALAALVLALTPVVVAMNRYNMPDTLLVLLLVLAAWALTRAVESGRIGWLLLSMTMIGLGFNTKMLQAWILVPVLALTYLVAAPPRLLIRIRQLAVAGVVLLAISFSWLVVVDLTPASERPYVGGSTDNSVLDLVVGYNGFGRILGQGPDGGGSGDGGGPGGGGLGFDSGPGWGRLVNDEVGGQISWLLPLAAVGLVAGLLWYRRARRTDTRRAAFILWGGWLAVHAIVFSFAQGVFHPYYVNALAPAIGALVGGGIVVLWKWHRRSHLATWMLAGAFVGTALWSVQLLERTPDWNPWLRPLILTVVGVGAGAFVLLRYVPRAGHGLAFVAVVVGLVGVLLGSGAYAVTPVSNVGLHDPTAGPAGTRVVGPPGRGTPPGPGTDGTRRGPPPPGGVPDASAQDGRPVQPGLDGGPPRGGYPGGGPPPGRPLRDAGAGADPELVEYLLSQRDGETWLVAATTARDAAPLILATDGEPVMAMGGFTGADPAPTSEELADYVESGELRYVLLGLLGGGRRPGRENNAERDDWIRANCSSVDPDEYGGARTPTELYDCAAPTD